MLLQTKEAMVIATVPKTVQDLHSFLGLLNYYWKFLPSLALCYNL